MASGRVPVQLAVVIANHSPWVMLSDGEKGELNPFWLQALDELN